MMKKALISGAAAVVALMALSAPVEAQLAQSTTGPVCTTDSGAWLPQFSECYGSVDGNNTGGSPGEAAVLDHINNWGSYGEPFNSPGSWSGGWLTNSYVAGGVADFTGDEGTIDLGGSFMNFVVALKQGDYFSLFYFGSDVGYVSSLDYSTAGVKPDATTGLSHWTLYRGEETSVPEPGSLLLLGTGLLGMAALRRRREHVV